MLLDEFPEFNLQKRIYRVSFLFPLGHEFKGMIMEYYPFNNQWNLRLPSHEFLIVNWTRNKILTLDNSVKRPFQHSQNKVSRFVKVWIINFHGKALQWCCTYIRALVKGILIWAVRVFLIPRSRSIRQYTCTHILNQILTTLNIKCLTAE